MGEGICVVVCTVHGSEGSIYYNGTTVHTCMYVQVTVIDFFVVNI